jgi:hypothetical protein
MRNYKQKRYSKYSAQWKIVGLPVVLLLVLGGVFWWNHYHHTKSAPQIIKTNSGVAKTNSNVPGSSSQSYNTNSGTTASKDQGGNYPGTAPAPSIQPAAPTGDFVSDHHPNLGGSPAPNTETSSCTTTVGVECQIRFTMNGVTKELPVQTTDGDGSTLWSNWTLQSIGLTQGSWQVTAVAINGSNEVTAQDPLQLVVAP